MKFSDLLVLVLKLIRDARMTEDRDLTVNELVDVTAKNYEKREVATHFNLIALERLEPFLSYDKESETYGLGVNLYFINECLSTVNDKDYEDLKKESYEVLSQVRRETSFPDLTMIWIAKKSQKNTLQIAGHCFVALMWQFTSSFSKGKSVTSTDRITRSNINIKQKRKNK